MNAYDLQQLSDRELVELSNRLRNERRRRVLIKKTTTDLQPVEHRPGGRVRYWKIYVLLLAHDKRYVGVTAQKVQARYEQHVSGTGAKWTKLHKPLGIEESYPIGKLCESEAVAAETAKTLDLMEVYGTENVRGGSLVVTNQKKLDRTYERLLRVHEEAKVRAAL